MRPAKGQKKDPPKFKIKKDDTVQVMSGKSKGEVGQVLRVDREKQKVYVKGVNMLQKHTKPRRANEKGGIIPMEGPIHISNVLLYDPAEERGVRVRVQASGEGVKNRVSVKTGQVIS
jgi:large subunit ribosomal protein L24